MVAEVPWTGLFSQELSCCRVRGLAAGSEQVVHTRFALTLVVNHACNLRCTYCFTGDKVRRPMRLATGRKAIDRALQSLLPGGTLHLGFFGGEPLIEADGGGKTFDQIVNGFAETAGPGFCGAGFGAAARRFFF